MWKEVTRITISNQYLDCILANTIREGSLFVKETFTYTYDFNQAFRRLYFLGEPYICKFKDGEIDIQEIPLGKWSHNLKMFKGLTIIMSGDFPM